MIQHASVERFVITHVNEDNMRQLSYPQQGRFTHATEGAAKDTLIAFQNNPDKLITDVYGDKALGTFEVRPCQCHADHYDPIGIYFDA